MELLKTWLRQTGNGSHINISELDAVLRGLNMTLKWDWHLVDIRTDSVFVCRWIESIVSGDKRIKVKGISEALVRRRLGMIQQIMSEYKLKLKMTLVPSPNNIADALTQVPSSWLRLARS